MKKFRLTRTTLLKLGLPAVLIPGLLLAATLGWNWRKDLKPNQTYYQNPAIFPPTNLVQEIQDGDTLILKNGIRLRLLGIDAPDRGQPYYSEAQKFAQEKLLHQNVQLEYEAGYQDDKFGRILAYVWFRDSAGRKNFFNQLIVEAGLAEVTIYQDRRPLIYQNQLLEAQKFAQKQKLNLWSKN